MLLGAGFGLCAPVSQPGGGGGGPIGGVWQNGYRYRIRRILAGNEHGMSTGSEGWVFWQTTLAGQKAVSNLGHVQNAAFLDLRYDTSAGQQIKHELESYDPVLGIVTAWLYLTGFVALTDYPVLESYGILDLAAAEDDPAGCWVKCSMVSRLSDGLDMSGHGRHLTLTGVSVTTLLGTAAGDFVRSDVPTWWQLPNRSGRAWAGGCAYWWDRVGQPTAAASFAAEQADVALIDAITGSSKAADAGNVSTWDRLIGGPIGGPRVDIDTQFDWQPSVRFGFGDGIAFLPTGGAFATDGAAWLVWVIESIPTTEATTPTDSHIWDDIIAGTHDAKYIKFGERIVQKMAAVGHPLKRLIVDANHEMNQSNNYQVFPSTRLKYKLAMERTIDKIRQGAGSGNYIRFLHRPGYRNEPAMVGPLNDWVPNNVDAIGLGFHPNSACNSDANITKLFNGTLNPDWYGTDELLSTAAAMGLPIAFPEWSPLFAVADPCPVADTFVQRFYDEVLVPNAPNIVCDCVFSQQIRDTTAYEGTGGGITQWSNMVATRKARWSGIKG